MGSLRTGQGRVALVLVVASLAYLAHALRMPWGSLASPGPAFFPVAVGTLVAGLGAILLLPGRGRDQGGEPVLLPAGEARRRVAGVWLLVVAYAALVTVLGHVLLVGLISVAILRLLGMRGWRSILLLAVAAAAGSHYLFAVLLGVPLPVGIWSP